ncbi:Phytanoyl-CoA dioxygenase (PhyH) [Thalassoglobus neptunius]|uniref:Phytanoyl-CoA dioxygenase (PhyH) n=1 Tax=Thalassoglobus neptunius TaxID=1938619 RepID=A0A5C5X4E5_9PLAN|nr:phytanoyl-CoA dioxygenase family protein [Thalassoglobus neptunius]TWT57598.1 Phytanoyl-CoA dioxygenase (PhyH) [Thalassoglobus neptunius]
MTDSLTEDLSSIHDFPLEQQALFEQNGFLVLREFVDKNVVDEMLQITQDHRRRAVEPVEYESDLNYPGAPRSRQESGGTTIRRLKQAHCRGIVFTNWINSDALKSRLERLLGPRLVCPLAHHNCIMTKEPAYSSDTGWHQDIRYWSYEKPNLISVWLALGKESLENGCLQVIPGSHRMGFGQHQFDRELFFRDDLAENQRLLEQRQPVELNPGDVLLFHCRTLHAATRNYSNTTKFSVVFTFRAADNSPRPGSRSASMPEMLLP